MKLTNPIFRRISRLADEQGVRAFVVGGYVRDHYLRQVRAAIGPDCKLLFVLKADAYGHGTPVCAKYSEEYSAPRAWR